MHIHSTLRVLAVAFSLTTTVLSLALPEYNPAGNGIKNLVPIPSAGLRSLSTTNVREVKGVNSEEGGDVVLTDGPIWARGGEGEAVEGAGDVELTDGPIWARGEMGQDKFKMVDSREVAGADKVDGADVVLTDGSIWARSGEDTGVQGGTDVVLTDGPIWAKKDVSNTDTEDAGDAVLTDGPIWAKREVTSQTNTVSLFPSLFSSRIDKDIDRATFLTKSTQQTTSLSTPDQQAITDFTNLLQSVPTDLKDKRQESGQCSSPNAVGMPECNPNNAGASSSSTSLSPPRIFKLPALILSSLTQSVSALNMDNYDLGGLKERVKRWVGEKEKRILGMPDCSDIPPGGFENINETCYLASDTAASVRPPTIFSLPSVIVQFVGMVVFGGAVAAVL